VRRAFVLFFLLFFIVGHATAQNVQRRPASIVLKFRSLEALRTPSAQLTTRVSQITSGGLRSGVLLRAYAKNNIQTLTEEGGLDRILILPITSSLSAEDAVQSLKVLSELEYVEPNYIYHIDESSAPNDPHYSKEWHLQNINAEKAWQITKGDSTLHLGFVDTGVDWWHPDLVHQFAINKPEDINGNGLFDPWPAIETRKDANGKDVTGDLDGIDQDGNGYADDVIGYDFVDQTVLNIGDASERDPIPEDQFSRAHGTAVAGVMAAEQNNAQGVSGVAPGCKLVALRAFDSQGNAEDDDIASAIIYAADNNVKIINLSYGDFQPSLLQRDAIRYATSKGCLVFASSGNEGGEEHHYPSDFDEVISVGGTTNSPSPDAAWIQSTHSQGLDVVAPATEIYTVGHDSSYQSIDGTSFASPITAATAALIWSNNHSLTPLEVRGILLSTTQDIKPNGYDKVSSNGRVDAARALSYLGSATVKITSVHTNDGFTVGSKIQVQGHATSTLFTQYSLSFAPGDVPDRGKAPNDPSVWRTITTSNTQVIAGTLGEWNTTGLEAGVYTLRLALITSDARSIEERITVRLLGEPPVITSLQVDTVFANDRRALLVIGAADQPTTCKIIFRDLNTGSSSVKTSDRLALRHSLLITDRDVPLSSSLSLQVVFTNAAGDSVETQVSAGIPNEAISQVGFRQKRYSLPAGYALDTVLNAPSGDHTFMSVFTPGGNFGQFSVFKFDGANNRFVLTEEWKDPWLPRAIGNTKGEGKDLLLQGAGRAMVLRLSNNEKVLADTLYNSSSSEVFWGSNLADVDGNGKEEIIGQAQTTVTLTSGGLVDSNYYEARSWNGSSYASLGKMFNVTAPEEQRIANRYEEPHSVASNIDGEPGKEVIVIDKDADVVVYKRDAQSASGFRDIQIIANDGVGEGSLVTTGDYNHDGWPDVAFAYHNSFSVDHNNEYPPAEWTVKVFLNNGAGKLQLNYVDHFAYARPINPYFSSVNSIPSVTGRAGDNLVFSLFPNLYLFEYDQTTQRMKPVWQYPVSVSPRGALAYDFDRNGLREFGFLAGDSIRFFERDGDFVNRTATPGGLSVLPIDTNEVDLEWGEVSGAEEYNVLRAKEGDPALSVIATVASTTYIDKTVQPGAYFYAVQAVDDAKQTPESLPSFTERAVVHYKPKPLRTVVQPGTVKVLFTQALKTASLTAGALTIDDSYTPKSIAIANDSAVVLTLPDAVDSGLHYVRVHSRELRDVFNSPVDTAIKLTFNLIPPTQEQRFFISNWRFEDGKKIHLTYNLVPGESALEVSHYTLTPYGEVIKITRDSLDDHSLQLELDSKTEIVALGVPFVLCVKDILAENDTPLESTEGVCAGVSLTEPNLDHVMVYPNPVKRSHGSLMFARLTAEAEVKVFSLDMTPIRQLKTTPRTGGVSWDLKDEVGRSLPSGVYLYYVTGKNDSGEDVEPKMAKFVIIADR